MKKIYLSLIIILINIHYQAFGSESDLYNFFWLDPDKKVFVLQSKYYKNTNKTFLSIGYLINTSNVFQNIKGINFGVTHFFNETMAAEIEYESYKSKESSSLKGIREINGTIPFIRRTKKYFGANFLWVPFYGKINTFNKIIYLDWGFGAGLGQIQTESNANTVAISNSLDNFSNEKYISAKLKTFFKININQKYFINLSYNRNLYSAPGAKFTDGSQSTSIRTDDHFAINFSIGF